MTPSGNNDMPITMAELPDLMGLNYVIVGDGEYVKRLVQYLSQNTVTEPSSILVQHKRDYLSSYNQCVDDGSAVIDAEYIVLGTGTFKAEMMARIAPRCSNLKAFLDVNIYPSEYCQSVPDKPLDHPYALFIDTHPQKVIAEYLVSFFRQLEALGIQVRAHNPLSQCPNWYLTNAKAVMVWNGSRPTFNDVVQQANNLGVDITYAECGFFPQHEYFYLDKCGVNAHSQLYSDDLSWVDESALAALREKRLSFKARLPEQKQGDYVFVPLQVPDDSNVLNHSTFTTGMQAFIDYILQRYPSENLIFKVHPKDHTETPYDFGHGRCSNEDTLELSHNAKLVHGINSSVLYEAALLGVTVIAEGDCLLKQHSSNVDTLLAAMIYRQFDVKSGKINSNKLSQFSHIHISECEDPKADR